MTAQTDSIKGIDWTVSVDSTINRAHQHATNTTRPEKDISAVTCQSKNQTPPTAGQVHDVQVLPLLLGDIRVPRLGPGRPRTTPDALLADKEYSSKRVHDDLAVRDIRTVIPERADQQANRKRKGRGGGRPRTLDTETYKRRNIVERSFSLLKQWRGLATCYDKLAVVYRSAALLPDKPKTDRAGARAERDTCQDSFRYLRIPRLSAECPPWVLGRELG